MRLFVAVWPPPDVCDVLQRLERRDVEGVRWTGPEQWHVTLRFFGETADADLPAITAAVREAGTGRAACSASLGRSARRLGRTALVVPVDGLDGLGAAVIERTRRVGPPPPDRPFTGHLTLARGRGWRPVPAALAGLPVPPATWIVRELALVRSDLDAAGARYTTLASAPLSG